LELNWNGNSLSVVFTTSNSSLNPPVTLSAETDRTGFSPVTAVTFTGAVRSGAARSGDVAAGTVVAGAGVERAGAAAESGAVALPFPILEFAIFAMRSPSGVENLASTIPTPLWKTSVVDSER